MKLKNGDTVIVIAGNEKGKEGKITSINNRKVVVQGVNTRKKHQKPQQATGKKGSIVSFDAPIDISNVAYSADGKAVKIRTKVNEEGKKELYYRLSDGSEKTIRTM